MAVGRLAVGRLALGRARGGEVVLDSLEVGRLKVGTLTGRAHRARARLAAQPVTSARASRETISEEVRWRRSAATSAASKSPTTRAVGGRPAARGCSSGCARSARSTGPRSIPEFPARGRLLVGDDGGGRPHGQPRLADLLLRTRRHHGGRACFRSSSRRRCSSAWTRPSTTASRRSSRRGFTPKRIADHEDAIRAIVARGARPARAAARRCDLVNDVAQPVVSRVIGSFMGIPPEDDAIWARADELDARRRRRRPQPRRHRGGHRARHPRDLRALPQADRRAPREPDRRPDERARARRGRRRRNSRSTRS